jgi:hypothetical protein
MSFARVRALVVIGVLAVAAVVFVVVAMARDSQGGPSASGCPAGFVQANMALPVPEDIKVKVFNATDTDGRGTQITEDFKNRRFVAQKPQNNDKVVKKVAILRYGPKMVGAAQLLRAYFLNQADRQYDPKRTSDVIDVVIGTEFQQLATTTEVNQALADLGEPALPPGACPAPQPKKTAK